MDQYGEQIVTHSRFFSTEFNTAIIDGPLRIYFADRQESDALQIYFSIQEALAENGLKLEALPLQTPNIFLMMYPNKESFQDVFDVEQDIAVDRFGDHGIFGISGPCRDEIRKRVSQRISDDLASFK